MRVVPFDHEKDKKVLIKKCHVCDHVFESKQEAKSCPKCNKSFLPINYFQNIKGTQMKEYEQLFSESEEMEEKDLIKGIHVLW